MKITKPRVITERLVGLVVDSETILGEWEGTDWRNVPPKARLYVNEPDDVRDRYEAGGLITRRWARAQRSYGRITGWSWRHPDGHPHTLYNMRGDFADRDIEKRFAAVLAFAEYAREQHANISGPGGTMRSILATSLDRDVSLSDRGLPTEQVWRGARIERRHDMQHEFADCVLWDIANAFPSKLIDASLPRRFRHYEAAAHETIPEAPSGFARAVVFVPPELEYGPLPAVRWPVVRARMRFPTDEVLTGVWSFEELRAAQNAGCDVMLEEYWTAHYFAQPFKTFGDLLRDMRRNMLPDAFRLAKRGAVGVVGALAREGQQLRSQWINGTEVIWEEGGRALPPALGLHGMITSQVRAQVYDEGIRRFESQFIACHTDGVILQDDGIAFPGGTGLGLVPGDWGAKREMQTLMLFDAQRYAYTNATGMHYAVAGVPENRTERWLERKAKGHAFRSRYDRI